MLTEFGKALRKLRLDRDEILRDMAVRLGISSSYLSSIEAGARTIPDDMIGRLTELYGLTADAVHGLEKAKVQCEGKVTIDLGGSSLQKMEAALLLARRFEDLDEQTVLDIRNFISRSAEEQ